MREMALCHGIVRGVGEGLVSERDAVAVVYTFTVRHGLEVLYYSTTR